MAKAITKIVKPVVTEEEKQARVLEDIVQEVAKNADGLLETIHLLQELHDSGILEALNSLVKAKAEIAEIAVGQLNRPPVTNMLNNAMAAAGALTEINPETTQKLMSSVSKGLQKAEQGLQSDKKVGILDLMKALKDPDMNRAIGFGLNLLKGVGEGLKE